ncbi:hypothetical protein [Curtobacterium herbarum]|uniref:Exo-alpha-sialidase n=1 Tax=Curtobacterium herbarum TaxID=150122 RepID=A0ABP4JZ81_9MICO|nr:hypothetical protein [Curtobacterium herbarum]MBM7476528.1 hypothetical protein [Curtobacterium herbarum]MCS6543910.1 hypothetical protein [Curtobacterium herbarum]
MAARRGTRNLGSSLTRTTLVWVAIVIVVLVVIDIALVTLALGRTAPNAGDPAGPIPTFSSSPRTDESASPTPTGTADAVASRRSLSAVDGQEAWRASGGTCGGSAPTLEHTTDAGATWKPVALGADVSSVMAIRASSADLTILAGVGAECTPTVRSSTDDGVTWTAGAAGAAGAGVSPAGLVLSTGVVDPPCSEPVEAFQGKQTAVVICDGHLEWRAGSGDWVDVPLAGVRSIADAGNEYSLARVGATTCAGVQVESMPAISVTPATTTTPLGCDADATTDGPISLARAGEDVWLWAGDTVAVSTDGGATW